MLRARVLLALTLLAGGCSASHPTDVGCADADNTLPKYGDPGYQTIWSRTPSHQRPAQQSMSSNASKRGWELLRQGDLTTAMKRFNQAWSLCPQNTEALWGMAIVQYERAKRRGAAHPTKEDLRDLDQAVSLLDKAAASGSPAASLLNDNAMTVATRGGLRKALSMDGFTADFDRAEQILRRAEAIEVHPLIYENWAALERYRGNLEAAQQYLEKARKLRGG